MPGADSQIFPPGWDADALLADGTVVRVRPIQPTDAQRHSLFVSNLSSETSYLRFFGPRRSLTAHEVAYFCNVDYVKRMAFVALEGDEIIAVARYDALGDRNAEVAFVISDRYQGRGLGTLLLEYLAEAARGNAISRFVAEVLPSNRKMLNVFRDAGYEILQNFLEEGVIHVEFGLEPTPRLAEKIEYRERTAEEHSIARLLRPRSVAVIGASHVPGTIGYHLFLNLLAGGFDGPVYPVNPNTEHVASVPAYASVLDIEHDVDLALVVVPAHEALAVVEQCAQKGVRGLVVISAGFAETGDEGRSLERSIVHAARAGGMRLVGPNCMGVANTAVGLNATFAPTAPRPGRVGFLSQSGALGIALLDWTSSRGLGISSFVSVGNKADVSGNDLLQYWYDDDGTDVILLYLESFGNPRKFSRLARRVSKAKPIVAVKSGRTVAGTRAASSHTAAAASPEAAVAALFQQTGVLRVDTLEELFDLAELVSSQPTPAGSRVAIVGNSGGPGILAADACAAAGLEVSELSVAAQEQLRALLGPNATVSNPVDMVASATPEHYESAIGIVLADPGVDSVIVIFTPPLVTRADDVAEAVARAAQGAPKPIVANFLASRDLPAPLRASLDGKRRRVPSFPSPEPAAIALGRYARYGAWLRRPVGEVPDLGGIDRVAARALVNRVLSEEPGGRWLGSEEADELAASYGVRVAEAHTARGAQDAANFADAMTYPVALKGTVGGAIHKTELGAVRLGLRDREELLDAYSSMEKHLGERLEGVVVQAMATPGLETIIGVVQDPSFGPLVMFGMGGVATELLADRAFRMLPVTDVDAKELVRSLRASPLLFGYRGALPADVGRLEETVLRVAIMADDFPEIAELDLNPVIVSEHDALAVDVKIRLGPATRAAPDVRTLR